MDGEWLTEFQIERFGVKLARFVGISGLGHLPVFTAFTPVLGWTVVGNHFVQTHGKFIGHDTSSPV